MKKFALTPDLKNRINDLAWVGYRRVAVLNILRLCIADNLIFLRFVTVLALHFLPFFLLIPTANAENSGSTIQLINTGNTQTLMQINLHNAAGANTISRNEAANPKGTVSIALSDLLSISAGQYSGDSSSAPNIIAGVVYGPGSGPYGKGLDAYPVETDSGASAYAPIVLRNFYGFNTMIRIMNTSSEPQNVDIFFYPGSPTPFSRTVPGNATWSVDLARDGAALGVDDGFSGSAKINGADNLSVVVQVYTHFASSAYVAPRSDGSGGIHSLSFPWVQKAATGLMTGLHFWNIGASASNLLLSFRDLSGVSSLQVPLVIPANALSLIYLSSLSGLPYGDYSVEAFSDQPTAGVAFLQGASEGMCAYSPSPSRIGRNLYAPFVKKGGGWTTSIYVNNVSAVETPFNYDFRSPEGSVLESASIEQFSPSSTVVLAPHQETFQGACTIQATNPISGLVLVKSPDGDVACYPTTTEQGFGRSFMPHLIKNEPAEDFPWEIFYPALIKR